MSPPLRILHVYKDYPPVLGGIEGHLHRLATAQAALGHDVTVLVTAEQELVGTSSEDGVRVVRCRRWSTLASTPLGPELPLRLRRQEADIAHLHFPYPLGELAQFTWGRSRRLVVSYYSDIVRQRILGRLWAPFARRLLRRADRLLATSPPHLRNSRLLREFPDLCQVVPLGVDVERFATADRQRTKLLRRRWGEPLLLFVGRLRYYKGLPCLFAAMDQLPGARLLVVGSGPMERSWKRIAAAGSSGDRIVFLGEVDDAEHRALLAAADLFVFPSVAPSEAFGLAQVEAMAAGKPVVGTSLGTGTDWVNRHLETGLIVPPGDSDALAKALRRLIEDSALRERLGRTAQQRARDYFSVETMVERIEAIYRELA